jgi:SHS2 domain-containing protein
MPYKYNDNVATADAAFTAWGTTMEEMFSASADALLNIMVENINDISRKHYKSIHVEADEIDILLYKFLNEIVYFKDTERILYRSKNIRFSFSDHENFYQADIQVYGEEIDTEKHKMLTDVKAITLYRLKVDNSSGFWKADVVVDI